MTEPWQDVWELLGQGNPTATVYRRLHPESARDLRAVFDPATGSRSLLFERSWRPSDVLPSLVQSRAVRMRTRPSVDGSRMAFMVTLSDAAFADVFAVLARDVAAVTAAAPDDVQATVALLDQMERWRTLLQVLRDDGLDSRFRRGLVAELHLLAGLLGHGVDPGGAVRAWVGPLLAHQDFQFPSCAVEVKSTAGRQPQSVTVSSERELDDTGVGALYLLHVSLDERRGGQGTSLNEAVTGLESTLDTNPAARALLQDRLVHYGYHDHQRHLYDEPRYTVRETALYRVTDDFPRITETGLPQGVGAVRYQLAMTACAPWRVDDADLLARLLSPGGTS